MSATALPPSQHSTLIPTCTLIVAALATIVGWAQSYPVGLAYAEDLLWNHISPIFWIGIALTFFAAAAAFLLRAGRRISAVVAICVAMAWGAPNFLFVVAGSDTPGILGLSQVLQSGAGLDAHVHEYFQWPTTFLLLGELQQITGLPMHVAAHLLFAAIASLTGLALFWFFGLDHVATAATAIFFTLTAPFLNWQLAPQVLAFAILIVLVQLSTFPRSPAVVVGSIVLFVLLCFTHPFVSLWFIGYTVIVWITRLVSGRHRRGAHTQALLSPLLLVVVQAAVTTYIATTLLLDISNAVESIGSAIESGGSVATAASLTFIGQASAAPDYLLVIGLSAGAAMSAAIVIVIGLYRGVRKSADSSRDGALFVVGMGHFFAGLVGPFLGGRGLQVAALSFPGAIRYALGGATRNARLARGLIVVSLLLAPAPIVAGSRVHTQYMTAAQLRASDVAVALLGEGDRVFGASVLSAYVAIRAGPSVGAINPQFADEYLLYTPGVMPETVIWSPELEADLTRASVIEPAAYYQFLVAHYERVHDGDLVDVWRISEGV